MSWSGDVCYERSVWPGEGVAGTIARGVEPIFNESWHRFWDVAEASKIPIHVHLGGGLHSLQAQLGSWRFPAMVAGDKSGPLHAPAERGRMNRRIPKCRNFVVE